jgi:hypothetical protein
VDWRDSIGLMHRGDAGLEGRRRNARHTGDLGRLSSHSDSRVGNSNDMRSSGRRGRLSGWVAVLIGASARECVGGNRVRRGRFGAVGDSLGDDACRDVANGAVCHRVGARGDGKGLCSRHDRGLSRPRGDCSVRRCCQSRRSIIGCRRILSGSRRGRA